MQRHPLTEAERVRALELMEMQRHAQLMYTSCGWFFDDISGIETVQVIAYAARVLQLAREVFGERAAALEPAFLARLAEARSNDPARGRRRAAFTSERSAQWNWGLEQVAAHYAISSVFSSFAEETELFCYRVRRISYDIHSSGRGRLALGRAHIASAITGQQQSFSYAVLHFGDQNITAAVKPYAESDAEEFEEFAEQAAEQVQRADFPEVIRLLDRYYGHVDYSLTSLFTDEQRRIVQMILNSTLWDIENSLTTIYEDHASLLHYPVAGRLAQAARAYAGRGLCGQRRPAARTGGRTHRPGAAALVPATGQGRPGAAGDGHAQLHCRPAHEARHGGVAAVGGIAGDAGPRADAGAHAARSCPSS